MRNKSLRAGVAMATMAVVAGGVMTLAQPAMAATTADTTTTFDIEAGALSITAQPTAYLGHVASSATSVSASLGAVAVDDARNITQTGQAQWTATVSIPTPFTNGTDDVLNADVHYTAVAGTVTATAPAGGTATGVAASAIGGGTTAQTFTGQGITTTTWTPTIAIDLATNPIGVGHYTGTVEHSVS